MSYLIVAFAAWWVVFTAYLAYRWIRRELLGRRLWAQRNAAMVARADRQHRMWLDGHPYGMFGEFMPLYEFIPEWMVDNMPSLREQFVRENMEQAALGGNAQTGIELANRAMTHSGQIVNDPGGSERGGELDEPPGPGIRDDYLHVRIVIN